jgi:hypothetical protein
MWRHCLRLGRPDLLQLFADMCDTATKVQRPHATHHSPLATRHILTTRSPYPTHTLTTRPPTHSRTPLPCHSHHSHATHTTHMPLTPLTCHLLRRGSEGSAYFFVVRQRCNWKCVDFVLPHRPPGSSSTTTAKASSSSSTTTAKASSSSSR